MYTASWDAHCPGTKDEEAERDRIFCQRVSEEWAAPGRSGVHVPPAEKQPHLAEWSGCEVRADDAQLSL